MEFIDSDGNIVVPKAVRPVVGLQETALGSKKGAARQYRHGNLHIRDYDSHYTVHMDRIDPRKNPLGHLLVDAPEYVIGAAAAALVGRHVGREVYKKRRDDGKNPKDAVVVLRAHRQVRQGLCAVPGVRQPRHAHREEQKAGLFDLRSVRR